MLLGEELILFGENAKDELALFASAGLRWCSEARHADL